MLADDLEALRQYKKRNTTVDRKASKGRRVRYNVHTKLQSYMFPIPVADIDSNTDRLLKSLFQ
jgi:protein AATF/BFR2